MRSNIPTRGTSSGTLSFDVTGNTPVSYSRSLSKLGSSLIYAQRLPRPEQSVGQVTRWLLVLDRRRRSGRHLRGLINDSGRATGSYRSGLAERARATFRFCRAGVSFGPGSDSLIMAIHVPAS